MSALVVNFYGGPGTGKTHTIKSICITLMRKGFTVKLLAPTGKAAQRLSESTKIEAETLHRFLKIMPKKGDSDFMNDNDNNENEEVIKELLKPDHVKKLANLKESIELAQIELQKI